MRYALALLATMFALSPDVGLADTPVRHDLIAEEVVMERGDRLNRCFDVDDGYLSFQVAIIRTPLPEIFRAMLYRAGDNAVRVGPPLLETAATSEGTSSFHRVDRGTYCLDAGLSKQAGDAARYGVIYLRMWHESA